MSFELKKKDVRRQYECIELGYCEMPNLLYTTDKIGYTAGIYGWNADIYTFHGVAIVTGYRPWGHRPAYKTIEKYEAKAKKAVAAYEGGGSYKSLDNKLSKLIEEFINECIKEAK